MRSNLVNAVIDGCRVKAWTTDEYKKWLAEYKAFEDKIEKLHPDLFDEFFYVMWGGSSVIGEVMFIEGWKLRGNVDELFNLPDGN